MKKFLFLLLAAYSSQLVAYSQNVGIGTNNPNQSAVLDVQSTNKGMLIPRMTTAQRKAIVNPESGLLVFDTDKRTVFMFEYPNWGQLSFKATDVMEPNGRYVADGSSGDNLGYAVAISGDYAVAGAPFDDIGSNNSQGSVYVFHRINGNWTQEAKIIAADGGINDQFGSALAMVGDTVLIGAPHDSVGGVSKGSAYIFIRNGTNWVQQAKLFSPDGSTFDEFGYSVSINSYFALIGCPGDDIGANTNQGSAYLYTRTGSAWTLTKKLMATGAAAGDEFGRSVSIDLNFAIVGSPKDDRVAADNGSAHIFWGSSIPIWSEVQALAVDGNSLNFGSSVYIKGDRAYASYGILYLGGYSKSYTRGGFGIWFEDSPDPIGLSFQYISNEFILAGYYTSDVGENSAQGLVHILRRTGDQGPASRTVHDPSGQANGYFGSGVAIDGLNVIIGAKGKKRQPGASVFFKY
jgi:hypothetical protein